MKKYVLSLVLLLVFAFMPKSALAQAASPLQSMSDFMSRRIYYDSMKMNNELQNYSRESRKTTKAKPNSGTAANSSAAASAARRTTNGTNADAGNKTVARGTTTFKPIGSYIFQAPLAKKYRKDPEERQSMEAAILKGFGIYKDFLASRRYAPNDVARSTSSVFILGLYGYYGKDLTQKQKEGIYKTIKDWFETNTIFQSWSDAERQEKYEYDVMMWTVLLVDASIMDEKNDEASRKYLKKTAETVFKDYVGFPISSVHLTADGMTVD